MNSVLIKDIMVPLVDYATVNADANFFEAVMALKEAHNNRGQNGYCHRAVLVLDNRQQVVGKVDYFDVLRALEPKYRGLGDLAEMDGFYGLKSDSIRQLMTDHGLWKQPLDDICRKAAEQKIRDLMSPPTQGEIVDENANLNEGVHQLILGRYQSLLVTRNNEVVGVLRLTDVVHHISDKMTACSL